MHENEKEDFDQRLYQIIIEPLINARKQAGITQKMLAELSGIPQGAISRYENGNYYPSSKSLLRITDALNLQIKFKVVRASKQTKKK